MRFLNHAGVRLLTIIAVAALAATATAQEPLRWKFEKGQKLNYNMIQDMAIAPQGGPQGAQKMEMRQEMHMTWDVQDINAAGEAIIKQKFDRLKVKMMMPPLGTIEYDDGLQTGPSTLTTPDARRLAQWLAAMVARRTTHAAIELSSHALDQDRCAGTLLDAAVVTNITQDHFDYHNGYQAYLHSKARIIEHLKPNGVLVLNADDPGAISIGSRVDASRTVITYGLDKRADVGATVPHETLSGSRFELRLRDRHLEVTTPLVGRHNVSNCLAAAAVADRFGLTPEQIARGIASLKSIPGRLERIEGSQPFEVFVDYAHTEDALRNAVRFLRRLTRGRVICVFAAGRIPARFTFSIAAIAARNAPFLWRTSSWTSSRPSTETLTDSTPASCASAARSAVIPCPPVRTPRRIPAARIARATSSQPSWR